MAVTGEQKQGTEVQKLRLIPSSSPSLPSRHRRRLPTPYPPGTTITHLFFSDKLYGYFKVTDSRTGGRTTTLVVFPEVKEASVVAGGEGGAGGDCGVLESMVGWIFEYENGWGRVCTSIQLNIATFEI
ncbi:hypothetical protein L2E82_27903 [Cichorium intybus]|uniref:Uncharacterized protein n=1 Tax=Cichorium intybus TaxID=13427 RepID=A0ACB9CU53_CICIN|nr:hypothetical protein L2E82_27903 [Cichorium intybus]